MFLSLGISLFAYDGTPNSDADILLGYSLLILTFPFGLGLAYLSGIVGQFIYAYFGYTFTTSYFSMILTWFVFFIIGYVQWFKFIPWLFHKWRKGELL